MRITALYLLFSFFLSACFSKNAEPKLPDTPDGVVRLWQESIDKNKFDLARQLSTGEALAYIAELSTLNLGDTLEWENNVLLNLRCEVLGDSAHCNYHFEDEIGEPDPGQLGLKKINGQWRVSRTDFDIEDSDTLHIHDLIFPEDSTELE